MARTCVDRLTCEKSNPSRPAALADVVPRLTEPGKLFAKLLPVERSDSNRSASFVGASRAAVTEGLAELWRHVQDSLRPAWVSLEAEPGAGKTRTVHEFYELLAARQNEPPYWPPTIAGDAAPLGPRKIAGPTTWDRPAGALPEYLWVGFSGRRGDGLPEAQLAAELCQIDDQFPLIQRVAGLRSQARVTISELGEHVRSMTFEELTAWGAEGGLKLVGAHIPGVSQALDLGGKVHGRYRSERKLTQRIRADEDVNLRNIEHPAVDEFVRKITFASLFMGVIVFVEDFHEAHPLLLDALKRLLALESGRLLIITTEWEVGLDRLSLSAGDRWVTITESGIKTSDQTMRGCFPPTASLAALDVRERAALVESLVPDSHPESAAALAAQYKNVQMLILVCSLGRTREALKLPLLDLRLIQDLPRKVEQFLDESWAVLDASVQDQLRYLACLSPASIEEASQGINVHFDERFDLTLSLTKDSDDPGIQRSIRLHWLDVVAAPIHTFANRQRRRLALREADDEGLGPDLWGHLAKTTFEPSWTAPAGDALESLALVEDVRDALIIVLARAGYKVHPRRLVEASFRLVVDLRAALGDLPIVAEIAGTAVASARNAGLQDDPLTTLLTELWAQALSEEGDQQRALRVLRPLLDLPLDALSVTHRLRISWLYARIQRAVEGADAALARLRVVDQEQLVELGPKSGDLLRTRCDIAFTEAVKGEYGRAQWILGEVLKAEWESGTESDLQRAEHQMASVQRRRGNLLGAFSLAESLLGAQQQKLGRTHPDTLATQQLLVAILRDRGWLAESIVLAEQLAELRWRVLGPSQATREARSHIAWLHRKVGTYEQAADEFKKLSEEGVEVDDNHWTTLRDLHNYAVCRRDAGYIDEAIEVLAAVQVRSEARDGARVAIIETVRERGRSLLGRYIRDGQSLDLEQGLSLLRSAQARASRSTGISAPMRWQLEIDLSCANGLSRNWPISNIQNLAALSRGQLMELGYEHPEVLRSQLYLSEAHRAFGRAELASTMREHVAFKATKARISSDHQLWRMVHALRSGKGVFFQ